MKTNQSQQSSWKDLDGANTQKLITEMFRNTPAQTPQLREAYVENVRKLLHYGVPSVVVFCTQFLYHNLYTSLLKEREKAAYNQGKEDCADYIKRNWESGTSVDFMYDLLDKARNLPNTTN